MIWWGKDWGKKGKRGKREKVLRPFLFTRLIFSPFTWTVKNYRLILKIMLGI
jgi:hypothetical protein